MDLHITQTNKNHLSLIQNRDSKRSKKCIFYFSKIFLVYNYDVGNIYPRLVKKTLIYKIKWILRKRSPIYLQSLVKILSTKIINIEIFYLNNGRCNISYVACDTYDILHRSFCGMTLINEIQRNICIITFIWWLCGFKWILNTFYVTFLCVRVVFLAQKCENESSLDFNRLLFRLFCA